MLVACESGPSGPGTVFATIDASAGLGAATLEVVGPGVTGFEGVGDTEAFGAVVSATQNRHRVVLVSPSGGTLRVGIKVRDLRAEWPQITVVSATGVDNFDRPLADIEVSLSDR
jgi:hypothetical protein